MPAKTVEFGYGVEQRLVVSAEEGLVSRLLDIFRLLVYPVERLNSGVAVAEEQCGVTVAPFSE